MMNQFLCSKYSYGQSSLEVNLNHKSDPIRVRLSTLPRGPLVCLFVCLSLGLFQS